MTAANEAISTDNPIAVTFDTLSAAQELRKTGLEDQQAEAIVATISKAMSETVATKSDIELLRVATKSDIQALRSDMDSFKVEIRADMESLRSEMKADMGSLRSEMKGDMESLRSEMKADLKLFEQSVDNRFEKVDLRFTALEQSLRRDMVTLQDKIVIKLGALMVTMTFLLLAIGPFYFRWVMSLMGSS